VLVLDRKDTLSTKDLLQKAVVTQTPPTATSPLVDTVQSRLRDFFGDGTEGQTAFDDLKIRQVIDGAKCHA